ncbi:MAG: hypothetical protein Q8T08_22280 [Ignavibacteria bacterium]|nr:hypothetical protein [Ignavibacteria bacterium]
MQKLEITITAKSWDDAKAVLAGVGIDEKNKINYRAVDGLYIVSVERELSLSDSDYSSIRDEPNMSILSDSESRQRITEVLDRVYDVETQLRKLLLHVSDLEITYFDILNNKYTKGYVDKRSISISGKLDPVTSHLTLGQMKDILGSDLSWRKSQLSAQDIADLLSAVNSFSIFKSKFDEKMQEKTMWDVIAVNVLHTEKRWIDINGDLNKLKEFRDQSAHYQIITERSKNMLVEKAEHLLPIITPLDRKLTKVEEKNLSGAVKTLSDMAKQIKPATFPAEYYRDLLKMSIPDFTNTLKIVGMPAQEAMLEALRPLMGVDGLLDLYRSPVDHHEPTQMTEDNTDNKIDISK